MPVEDGIPYAIDFMNPAPDADLHSVGQANFDWIVREVADLAIAKAKDAPNAPKELRWSTFLSGTPAGSALKKPGGNKSERKSTAKKSTKGKDAKSPAGAVSS